MTNVQQSMDYYLTAADAESRRYHLEVIAAPTINTISHDLIFPPYTKIEPSYGQEGGQIEAIEGTKVIVHAQTNMPVERAAINLSYHIAPVTMDVSRDEPTELTGTFEVKKSGTYKIDFRATGNHLNPSPVNYDVFALPDRPPTVRFVQPAQPNIKVPANVKVELVVNGKDDHGVKDATLHIRLKNEDLVNENLLENQEPRPEFRARKSLDLAQLRVKEGDILSYWLTARDNKDPSPNRVDTVHQTIEVTAPATPEAKRNFEAAQKKDAEPPDQLPPAKRDELAPGETSQETPPPADGPNARPTPPETTPNPGQNPPAGNPGTGISAPGEETADRQPGPEQNDQGQGPFTPDELKKLAPALNELNRQNNQAGQPKGNNASGAPQPGANPANNATNPNNPNTAPAKVNANPPNNGTNPGGTNSAAPQQPATPGQPSNGQNPQNNANPGDGTQVQQGIRANNQPPQANPDPNTNPNPGPRPQGGADHVSPAQPNATNPQQGPNAANPQQGPNAANPQQGMNKTGNPQQGPNAANPQQGPNAANPQQGMNKTGNPQQGPNAANPQQGPNATNPQQGTQRRQSPTGTQRR